MSYTFLPSIYNPNEQNIEIIAPKAGNPNIFAQISAKDSIVNPAYKAIAIDNYTDAASEYYSALVLDVDANGNNYSQLTTIYGSPNVFSRFGQTASLADPNYMLSQIINYTNFGAGTSGELRFEVSSPGGVPGIPGTAHQFWHVVLNGVARTAISQYIAAGGGTGNGGTMQFVWVRNDFASRSITTSYDNPLLTLTDFASSDDTVDTSYVDIPTPLGNYRMFTDVISVTFAGNQATFVMPFSISIRGVQACSNNVASNTNIIAANWSGTTITLRASANGLIDVNLSVVGYV